MDRVTQLKQQLLEKRCKASAGPTIYSIGGLDALKSFCRIRYFDHAMALIDPVLTLGFLLSLLLTGSFYMPEWGQIAIMCSMAVMASIWLWLLPRGYLAERRRLHILNRPEFTDVCDFVKSLRDPDFVAKYIPAARRDIDRALSPLVDALDPQKWMRLSAPDAKERFENLLKVLQPHLPTLVALSRGEQETKSAFSTRSELWTLTPKMDLELQALHNDLACWADPTFIPPFPSLSAG